MYNVIQREINVVYFNFHINSVREGQNNIVIFNVKSHNFGQRRNNIVNMTICKKLMRAEKYFWAEKKSSVKKAFLKICKFSRKSTYKCFTPLKIWKICKNFIFW